MKEFAQKCAPKATQKRRNVWLTPFQIPIVDETGLAGAYDIDLRWKVRTDPNANQAAMKQALIEQLGLELVPAHKSVELLIVEKVR